MQMPACVPMERVLIKIATTSQTSYLSSTERKIQCLDFLIRSWTSLPGQCQYVTVLSAEQQKQ
ncbi:rCG40013 [Rattus norvegicus]|uniref:RCG40013 n=1 Tax=Rattus norvegicus TaxID=10116 RepID=A6I8P3_RAT|nr:rCG40013 [Rattus norvegicus]